MSTENTSAPIKQEIPIKAQPAWYDFLFDIFKKLLEFNSFTYGAKKKF